MKTFGIQESLFAIAICAVGAIQARAAVITGAADWNFGTSQYTTAPTLNPAVFSAAATPFFSAASKNGSAGATAVNGGDGNSGYGFVFTAAGHKSLSESGGAGSFVLSLKVASGVTSPITSIIINYNYLSDTQPGQVVWTTSAVVGGGGQTRTISQTSGTTWNSGFVSYSGLSLSAGSTYTFTMTLAGFSANGGSCAFDNISIDAGGPSLVPEPIAYALPLFGLIFIGGTAGRFYWKKAEGKI